MSVSFSAERGRELAENLARVREGVAEAARRSGRDPAGVTLLAVSKTFPAADVAALAAAGQAAFGESYVQEALAKRQELRELPLAWHFIGGLQSNKAKFVAGAFDLIHGVDSLKLAQALHKKSAACGLTQPVLLQVNLGREARKSGVAEEEAQALAEAVLALPSLRLSGLMVLPPWDPDPELSRPYFARLRELRDTLASRLGVALPHLSMGMSGDFAVAVEEGATIVRVGTTLFGSR